MNTPIISVSSTRKAIIYSFTRAVMEAQLARMQSGIRSVVSSTNGRGNAVDAHMEADRSQPGALLDELELRRGLVEVAPDQQRDGEGEERGPQRDVAGVAVGGLVAPRSATMRSAPSSGRKVTVERIGQG